MRKSLISIFAATLLLNANTLLAEANSITIRGDKESPTVLYFVPWKNTPQSGGNTDFELDLDFNYQPISRSEVIREVRYFKELGYDKTAQRSD